MKILYIIPDITDSGGISRVLSLKTNYLVGKLNYEISMLSVNDCSSVRFYDFNPNIKWFNFKKSKITFSFFNSYIQYIKNTIAQENPDIIIVCDAELWLLIPWVVKTKIPLIFETHFPIVFQKSKLNLCNKLRQKAIQFVKERSLEQFSCLVTLTQEEKALRKSNTGIVIPNPVSFEIKTKASLLPKKAMSVCMNPYVKGLDRLLMIWSEIIQKHPEWTLDIYGQWNENDKFVKMATDLKCNHHIHFLPPTKAIEKAYLQSSIYIMTSRFEAFPMVLLEAMSFGIPCLAYDISTGPKAIIEQSLSGFLIENDNLVSYVEKLDLLMSDEDLRLKMGAIAQKNIIKYNIDLIMKKWESLFLDLTNKP